MKPAPFPPVGTLDPDEIAKFQRLAGQWWDPSGPMAPLHAMHPCRLESIVPQITHHFKKMKGLNILDVGCGGGLVAESLARLGAKVTGIDGASDLIAVARTHARDQGLMIDYDTLTTTALLQKGKQKFDVVLALEVIEHVADPDLFVAEVAQLLRPGGLAIFSTLNRTLSSFAFGVVAAERVLNWLPAGTHDWQKFLKPSELHALCTTHGLHPLDATGMTYHPLSRHFTLDARNLKINYLMSAAKNGI